ncbi:MAG: asparaginase [Paracoccaceae bacterium]|nr:asparaginase [Paracoccaceae bacterium]
MDATINPVLAEIWRGPILESVHRGAAVVVSADGIMAEAWGDPGRVILPRSACKMLQALPLVESGAADAAGLTNRHLALACSSHDGVPLHVDLATGWLSAIGKGEADLRCGAHPPDNPSARHRLRLSGVRPDQRHNNCSGKHCGFLTLARHLGAGPDYLAPDHPVQQAARMAIEETAGEESQGFAIDGCSAPNFALSLKGLATAMARFAAPEKSLTGARADAAARLRDAMAAHPDLTGGESRAGTHLTRAARGRAVVKSGAEGVYVAILPGKGLGIALKIDDGNGRGSQAAIAALLARHGAIEHSDPVYKAYADAPILNCRRIAHGHIRAGEALRG